MRRALSWALLGIGIGPTTAFADGWWGLDHALLPGHAIVATGEASKESRRNEDFSRTEWFEFQGRCFEDGGQAGASDGDTFAAILLIDKEENSRMALLKSGIGHVEIKVISIRWIRCPSSY